jgi:hypothetical protein
VIPFLKYFGLGARKRDITNKNREDNSQLNSPRHGDAVGDAEYNLSESSGLYFNITYGFKVGIKL